MHRMGNQLHLSATDIALHLACKHLTQLNREVAEGRRASPHWEDPVLDLIQQRGLAHEEAYIESLVEDGLAITRCEASGRHISVEPTLEAMKDGADVIVQAGLELGRWRGRSDLLMRVEKPSSLGAWSYEVIDTKLARETKAGTILQLCLYTEMVAALQDLTPELMHVVTPGGDFERDSYRYHDFQAYYRLVRAQLERSVAADPPPTTYPEPVNHCDICSWWHQCDARRRSDDHLCLVAGIGTLHIRELDRQGITTLTQFAEQDSALPSEPERGNIDTYETIHAQARIQLDGRRRNELTYELLPTEVDRGLQRLPCPCPGDIFFDFEADPFVDDGGLEYLFGYTFSDTDHAVQYRGHWAESRAEEKRAFEDFIGFVMARWATHPEMHIYHFAPYEPAALKRLMGRHATRETEMDQLLRAGRFVDLHAVARQGIRASVERYSLKDLEAFFEFRREIDLRRASASLRRIAFALELGTPNEITAEDRATVQAYNRDDCLATSGLRNWLEARRAELEQQGLTLVRPDAQSGEASDSVEERAAEVQAVFDRLVADLPEDQTSWSEEQDVRWLLAHLLDYFRREDRCAWWEFFRLYEADPDELVDERKAVVGLQFEGEAGGTARCPIHRYRFPFQEVSISEGDVLHEVGGDPIGSAASLDTATGILEIKKRGDATDKHPGAVVVNERVAPEPLDGSLLALADSLSRAEITDEGQFQAARDLLGKRPPRLRDAETGPLRRHGEDLLSAAHRLADSLHGGVLPIQGPPGSGKTYTGARMIAELLRSGKRVGVTAVSHKVIRNLLDEVIEAGQEMGIDVRAVHKVSKKTSLTTDQLEEVTNNDEALACLDEGKLLGGTAWLWARDDAVQAVDYLFVDEAGQLSLAHVLAASRATQNLILLGDPQQLEQPQRGAHPEGAEIAALNHILDGQPTIPEDRGLFLEETWRLHPAICFFTSELYYEDRLRPRPENAAQAIVGDTPFAGAGLFLVPVEHTGNQNTAVEEVDVVSRLVDHFLTSRSRWRDIGNGMHDLRIEDVLIVAPYNAHVGAILLRRPEARVGTVDRFQGQEAPIVIYSLASSSAEDAPRGLSFLYDPHRLNVATSRARCVCIVLANPRLFEPECRSPQEMRLANGLCRFRELAKVVELTGFGS